MKLIYTDIVILTYVHKEDEGRLASGKVTIREMKSETRWKAKFDFNSKECKVTYDKEYPADIERQLSKFIQNTMGRVNIPCRDVQGIRMKE